MNEVLHLGCSQLSGDIMGEAMYVGLYLSLGEICTLGAQTMLWGGQIFALLGLGPAEPWQNFLLPGGSREPEGG